MKLLYSNIPPLMLSDGQQSIIDCIHEQMNRADRIDIAVGYVSRASLEELERLAETASVGRICLTIGMYYTEGMPENTYHTAVGINRRWVESGIGEIRLVTNFKFHGKDYCFYKDGVPISAISGSANLGILKADASNRRQYETAVYIDEQEICAEKAELINRISDDTCSKRIDEVTDLTLIREENNALSNVENVDRLPNTQVDIYYNHMTDITFELPLKVPAYEERFMDDMRHYIKSNINVCYAAPRSARKPRDWFETQLTVSKEVREQTPGYPEKNVPFFVITDDGYWFKAHTTSQGNKQFSAVGDELIMGRWLKGRLAAAGLVTPVNNTQADTDHTGMITKEMLQAYGRDKLVLTKTDMKAMDSDGNELDVWVLSFESGV